MTTNPQLVLEAAITGSQNGVAEARIIKDHFRTCRTVEPDKDGTCDQGKAPAR